MITAEEARKHLRYAPETGELWWRIRASGRRMDRPAGAREVFGYIAINVCGQRYKAHRLIWLIQTGKWPTNEIDHKNLQRDDNRWCNLRAATRTENQRNSSLYKNGKSGKKGVTWHVQHRKWYAAICVNKRNICLGLFSSVEEAHAAYVNAAAKYFGAFARVE